MTQTMAGIAAADGYEGATHAGLALVATDTGAVFLAQRAPDPTDAADVAETWEFPGGSLEPGEVPIGGALREFAEEIALPLPLKVWVTDGWRSVEGIYQGFVLNTPQEFDLAGFVPNEEVQKVGWFTREMIDGLDLRPEVRDQTDWGLIFGVSGNTANEGDTMPDTADETAAAAEGVDETEPEWDTTALAVGPTPIHGIMAPEDIETGDQRGFNAGSMTARPLRLPFSWQEVSIGGHDGSVVVGSVDRLMRKDGMIHWEGQLMPASSSDPFADLLAFFGRFGVSVDGDKGSLDQEKSVASGVLWFDAVRASGLTAVSIPAFHEAYVAFGPSPVMPADNTDEALTASGVSSVDMAGARTNEFKRGPGWVTNPKETNRLHDYWTKKGQPGYIKVGWGTPGDFTRAKHLIGEKIAKNSPEKMKYLNQIIAQWHHDALGYWPGDLNKPGNDTTAEARAKRAGGDVAASDGEGAWEAVLTSSGGDRVLPPLSYFNRHPDTGATVIEEPDANGLRRTYGYAAERGVCHIGYAGECVEAPMDEASVYEDFHLGRTKTIDGYINTGLITYGIDHRDADEILSETATQQHFVNLSNAWAAVRIGTDERGVWFSGVVLPTVEEKWITAIEASGQVSGEWKYGALRSLLTVNVPGFPVLRSSAVMGEDGTVLALVASAHGEYKVTEDLTCESHEECGKDATMGVWLSPNESAVFCDTHYSEAQVDWQCPEETDDSEALASFMASLREDWAS
ncbi:NUDIX hydrolase [Aeromicrobium sp.]|uniref:NUDIX hydrolase n=1 Tax=Aeromicrobium sp. TaxID=1871063 RepID=UPI00199A462C|nr:NUDIX hydrolase [Aeromicrobium sp.]MBC7630314.1 NUDIX hydrolase [Aeromicrobium sp.]